MNKIVARFADGNMLKGFTTDFAPGREQFHVSVAGAPAGSKPQCVQTKSLKALFFVRDFAGNAQHDERLEFDPGTKPLGRKIRVVFKDGEVMLGTTQGYQRDRPGFFLVPADLTSNTERCYVVCSATEIISFPL